MLTKRIIPCLDVKDNRVVKGVEFLSLRDAGDPVELAAFYDEAGADEIVFLDITASFQKRKTVVELCRRTAEKVFIPFTIGGGISDIEDIKVILRAGADKVSINSAAVRDKSLIKKGAMTFGSQCIVVAIDAKFNGDFYEVYIDGGNTPTGMDAVSWAKEVESLGAGEILLTSMDRDGTKRGYDLELLSLITGSVNIPVIASGGAGCLEHLYEALTFGGADAVLAASIFHYGIYTIKEAKKYLSEKGVPVRVVEI